MRLLFISILLPIFLLGQSKTESTDFTRVSMLSLKKGDEFLVELNSKHYNTGFKEYHKRGKGNDFLLEELIGEIILFDRYENRTKTSFGIKESILSFIFKTSKGEIEYTFEETYDNLKGYEEFNDDYVNISSLIYYKDALDFKNKYEKKIFFLIKDLNNGSKPDKLYFINIVKAHNSEYPVEIEYFDFDTKDNYTVRFKLSGTNQKTKCNDSYQICDFKDYFLEKEEYLKYKKLIFNTSFANRDGNLYFKKGDRFVIANKIKKGDTLLFLNYLGNKYQVLHNNKNKGYIYENSFFAEVPEYGLNLKTAHLRLKDSLLILQEKKEQLEIENLLKNSKKSCDYNTNEVDEFTGKKKKITNFYSLKENDPYNKLQVQLTRNGSLKYVTFDYKGDLGCASPYSNDRSTVKIKLENGKVVTFYHFTDIHCADYFSLDGKLSSLDIKNLKSSKIKTIRLTGTDYYTDLKIGKDFDWGSFFIDKLKCID